jgi:hypothetical protein
LPEPPQDRADENIPGKGCSAKLLSPLHLRAKMPRNSSGMAEFHESAPGKIALFKMSKLGAETAVARILP